MKRRKFLKMGAASLGGAAAWSGLIEKALALPAHNPTGNPGLADIEHVVIFMQENRSFDHYFGSMPGVRGFGDPRPTPIPSGNTVWYQPEGTNPQSRGFSADVPVSQWTQTDTWYESNRSIQSSEYVLPFRLNQKNEVAFQYLTDLNHSWKQSQQIWDSWDGWVPMKSRQSMGFLTAHDLPFYHPLASAFTVCDDYRCSVFAATDPNRFYLWSGTCPPPMNFPDAYTTGGYVADITHDDNGAITPAMYGQSAAARRAAVAAGVADWKTYPETLTDARVTWKVYQEFDNYGDNYLQYYKNFRVDNDGVPINQSQDPYFKTLYQRGRSFAPQAGKVGDAVIAQFAADVAAGAEPDNPQPGQVAKGLPRVSWVVAPYDCCEHPSASPGDGEAFTAKLLNVLVNDHPEVFRKTAFFLMYDENDGYFDHLAAPVPAISAQYGAMTLSQAGAAEDMGSIPVGLGPRVPMLVISPWTRGGKVSSQLYDHTSTLRFLEQWLPRKRLATEAAVRCQLISPWRRAVCGDLTELFDFSSASVAKIRTSAPFVNGTEPAAVPSPQQFPALPAAAVRTACPSNAKPEVSGEMQRPARFALHLSNSGTVGAAFSAFWMPMSDAQQVFHYTVEAGRSLSAAPVSIGTDGLYDWSVHGPNGFVREFRGNMTRLTHAGITPEATVRETSADRLVYIVLDNRRGTRPCTFQVADNAYRKNHIVQIVVPAGAEIPVPWGLCAADGERCRGGWYDVSVRVGGDASYLRRLAGSSSDPGEFFTTDPANANPALFKPALSVFALEGSEQRIDYVTPPWHHRPKNWIGIFAKGAKPAHASPLLRAYAAREVGSVEFATKNLPRGEYDAWYLFDDGTTSLADPASFEVRGGGHHG